MLNQEKFAQLEALCKFDFTEDDKARFLSDLNSIIGFIDKVKDFSGEYDDTLEESLAFGELREDEENRTATVEQLLMNTKSENGCYIIPKVVD